MRKILVSYDLMAPGKNYQPVYDYLESYTSWIKPLRSVYLLQTAKSVRAIRDDLKRLVDGNDKILAVDITYSGWATYNLPKASKWLRS
jgi:hypothetical protein